MEGAHGSCTSHSPCMHADGCNAWPASRARRSWEMEWGTRSLEREQLWAGSAPARVVAAAAMGLGYSPAACSESTVSHLAGDQRRSVCLEFSTPFKQYPRAKSRQFGLN